MAHLSRAGYWQIFDFDSQACNSIALNIDSFVYQVQYMANFLKENN